MNLDGTAFEKVRILMLKGEKGDKGDGSYDDTEVRGLIAGESVERRRGDATLSNRLSEFISANSGTVSGTKITETVLSSDHVINDGSTIVLSDDPANYDYIRVRYTFRGIGGYQLFSSAQFTSSGGVFIRTSDIDTGVIASEQRLMVIEFNLVDTGNDTPKVYRLNSGLWKWDGVAANASEMVSPQVYTANSGITEITGIKIENVEASKDTELTDIRVGVDGTVYQSAGEAVRSQIAAIGSGGGGGDGLTEAVKLALLQMAQKVAYIDANGQDYYDDLYDALYPPLNLVSISAVYTQSGTVYDTDSLDSLKSDLVVTALYSDTTTETVTTYTLSGTLTAGTSTITVSYGGKTTTFNVTVTHAATDTTAVIDTSGKILIHKNTSPNYTTANAANAGITKLYDMDAETTTLYPAGIIPTDAISSMKDGTNVACLFIYDSNGEPINFVNELTTSAANRWVQLAGGTMTEYANTYTVAAYSKIAFSVDTRYLDDAYMYDMATGQVWFAGINTPYYGMSNISEANV